MSKNYFDDIEFVTHGEHPLDHRIWVRDFKDYWGIQFFRKGRFFLKINDNPTEYADRNAVFLSFPGAHFEYGTADEHGVENRIFVCFRGERVRRYLDCGFIAERHRNALLTPGNPDEFLARMRRLRALLLLSNHARAVYELEGLLLELNENASRRAHRANIHFPKFAALTDRIAARPELAWNFIGEAKKLAVSYTHFRRLFEQFFGTSPGAFLLTARLNKAAELLVGTPLSIREIAIACGFQDEHYFSRCFSRHREIAPKFFRSSVLNK